MFQQQFSVDLKHIDGFSYSVFDKYTSLESVIVHENQFIQSGAFISCFHLKKLSLPGYLHLTINRHREKQCELFYSDIIEELTICSDLKNVIYSIVYMVMYKIIQRNTGLHEQKSMNYKLYPIEVAIGRLGVTYHGADKPGELLISNLLYFYFRNAP